MQMCVGETNRFHCANISSLRTIFGMIPRLTYSEIEYLFEARLHITHRYPDSMKWLSSLVNLISLQSWMSLRCHRVTRAIRSGRTYLPLPRHCSKSATITIGMLQDLRSSSRLLSSIYTYFSSSSVAEGELSVTASSIIWKWEEDMFEGEKNPRGITVIIWYMTRYESLESSCQR